MKTMMHDLANFDIRDITNAFELYRRTNDKIPTVNKIIPLCEDQKVARIKRETEKPFSPNKPISKPKGYQVPWYGKMWADFTEYDKKALNEHMQKLANINPKKAYGYSQYLHKHCKAPKDLFKKVVQEVVIAEQDTENEIII